MNGFLVVSRCGYDDMPVRFFAGIKEARDWLTAVDVEAEAEAAAASIDWLGQSPLSAASCTHIVEFRDGMPVRLIRDPEFAAAWTAY